MASKRKIPTSKRYTVISSIGSTATAGHYRQIRDAIDIKSILESYAGVGEEVKILKAILRLSAVASDAFMMQPAVIVADQAIAATVSGGTTAYSILDDDMDLLTAGDLEFKPLGDVLLARNNPESGDLAVFRCDASYDITEHVRRASQMLVRSALLATNPEVHVVVCLTGVSTAMVIPCYAVIQIDYQIVAKPLRMLT